MDVCALTSAILVIITSAKRDMYLSVKMFWTNFGEFFVARLAGCATSKS